MNQIILGDCLEVMSGLPKVGIVITDPPYPNNAGHFDEGVAQAEQFIKSFECEHWIIFWDEMTLPPSKLPLVARHIWHRTNTNRPDNYEAIYEFHANGKKRPSRVLRHSVIYPGLTGIVASGHPTEKNVKLMRELIMLSKSEGIILDPFAGSGSTLRAAKDLNRPYIGIEINPDYVKIAQDRLKQEVLL